MNERTRASTRRQLLAAAGGLALTAAASRGPAAAATVSNGEIRLSLNESAYGPSPRALRALEAARGALHRYPDDADTDALIQQIASLERVAPGQVVLGEVLEPLGAYLAATRGGGGIVYSDPGYTALIDSATPLGGRGRPVPLDDQLRNDLPALARAVTADTIAVSVINPHNPSGTVSDAAAFATFVRDVGTRALVVVDEAYLEYDDLPGLSAVRLLRDGANVLVFRTLAKIYGLAGLSFGYALAPAPLAAQLRQRGIGAPHSLSRPALAVAAAALADQAYVQQIRRRNQVERGRVTRAIDAGGWRHTDARGNFVFFDAAGDAAQLRAAFARARILIGRPFAPLDSWLRITIGKPAENDAVIALLAQHR